MRISLLAFALCYTVLSRITGQPLDSAPSAGRVDDLGRFAETQVSQRSIEPRHGADEHEHAPIASGVTHHLNGSSSSSPSPGGHAHWHGKAMERFNETWVLETHGPDPLSYYAFDRDHDEAHPALIWLHIVSATVAFFLLLPLTIALKSGSSPFAVLAQLCLLLLSVLSLVFGIAYKSSTPNLYEGNSHRALGWTVMVGSIALNGLDLLRILRSMIKLIGSLRGSRRSSTDEGILLVAEDSEHFAIDSPTEMEGGLNWTEMETNSAFRHIHPIRRSSTHSSDGDGTLYDSAGPGAAANELQFWGSKLSSYAEPLSLVGGILLVVLAYVELLSGISVYSGSCRGAYLNGCLAHLIKGSIFFIYGLITWMRYLGLWSPFGWAWNKAPASSKAPSAEFVESFVMFLYGCTNTWMERFGKTGGYSVKDAQHISIDVMFWFGGIVGMLLESKRVRAALATPVVVASALEPSSISPPASYSASFNPFPAIIVGTTGVAMSAHAQVFAFQVSVHALWGLLLGLFALFRFLTYFFLYLRPPASILPSRPPTEALAALSLTCGGIVFMLSTEQVTFAAMRHGADDLMAGLNVTVAFASVAFAWIMVLFAIQGWALGRSQSRLKKSVDPPLKA